MLTRKSTKHIARFTVVCLLKEILPRILPIINKGVSSRPWFVINIKTARAFDHRSYGNCPIVVTSNDLHNSCIMSLHTNAQC